jgi:hypothetical protein
LLAERIEALISTEYTKWISDKEQAGKAKPIMCSSERDLEKVLAGIDAARAADLAPIKLNVVVLKENEVEIGTCDCERIMELLQEANKRREPYFNKSIDFSNAAKS